MSSAKFSEHVRCRADLYEMATRNGYYLPDDSSSAVNEVMLLNIMQGAYWCPKTEDIRIKNCVKPPVKDVLFTKLEKLCLARSYNIAWMSEDHLPNRDWMVAVIATLDPQDEIFKKDYVAPPTRKRLRDIETIVLPNQLFEGLPQSKRKVKARRLKIMSEAFAAEKASRIKDLQKELYKQLVEQEEKREEYKLQMGARTYMSREDRKKEKEKKEE